MSKVAHWVTCVTCHKPFYPIAHKQRICLECVIQEPVALLADSELDMTTKQLSILSRKRRELYKELFGATEIMQLKTELLFMHIQAAETKLSLFIYKSTQERLSPEEEAEKIALAREIKGLIAERDKLTDLKETHVALLKTSRVTTATIRGMLEDTDGSVVHVGRDDPPVSVDHIFQLLE